MVGGEVPQDELEKVYPFVANHKRSAYHNLKKNVENDKVENEDIDNIMDEIVNFRRPIKRFNFEFVDRYRSYFLHSVHSTRQKFACCCRGKRSDTSGHKHEASKSKQAKRKLKQGLEVGNLLKSIHISHIVSNSFLSKAQKTLTMFQRAAVIESVDNSESSDELAEFYRTTDDNEDKIKEHVTNALLKMTEKTLTPLDRVLLKGFYTCDRRELEDPRIMDKKVKVNPFSDLFGDVNGDLKATKKVQKMMKSVQAVAANVEDLIKK